MQQNLCNSHSTNKITAKFKTLLMILCLLACTLAHAKAQFYDTGPGRTSTKWSQIDSSNYKIIYPSYYQTPANSIAELMNKMWPYISHGINVQPRKIPVVLRTENTLSNGYVTWAPLRQEMVMTPDFNSAATQWKKTLTVHEWRHVVQLSSLNFGLTKVASWLFGQGGSALALLFVPRWVLEGDATIAETQFAEYGRGMQPDFTVEYRALFHHGEKNFTYIDKWVGGSYKTHYPDYYRFGYQVLSGAEKYLGSDYLAPMFSYSGKWPIVISPTSVYLRRNYGTTYKKIAQKTFKQLDSLWMPFADVTENFEHITPGDFKNYTHYGDPMQVDGHTVVLRRTLNTYNKFYNLDTDKKIANTGHVTSPAILANQSLIFTEYRPHPIFDQVNFSVIRQFDLTTQKTTTHHRSLNHWAVTQLPQGFAAMSMDSLSNSFINLFDHDFNITGSIKFNTHKSISLHGLVYDSLGDQLCFIALCSEGMWLGSVPVKSAESPVVTRLTRPSVISIRDLDIHNGTLYYSSIQSGKNEIHSLHIATKTEKRLTQSKFGSAMPTVIAGDSLLFTTYTASGTMVAKTALKQPPLQDSIRWSRKPINLLNPDWVQWDVPKIDTMDIESTPADTTTQTKKTRRAKRYKPEFPVHTWAPIAAGTELLSLSQIPRLTLGVSAFMQSTLGTYSGMVSYGMLQKTHWASAAFNYNQLPVKISASIEYGGGTQWAYGGNETIIPQRNPYLASALQLTLPLKFSKNGYSKLLQPSLTLNYTNTQVFDHDQKKYTNGLLQYSAQVWWSSNRYMARRNLQPKYGYAVRASIVGSFDDDFATQYSLWARGYLPGFLPNHSLSLRAGVQTQKTRNYNFSNKVLNLVGIDDRNPVQNYWAMMADYTLPILYPDWGWDGIIFFNRISATLLGGYSMGGKLDYAGSKMLQMYSNHTYGVSLNVDFMILRSFSPTLSFTFAMPNNKFFFGMGLNFGL